MKNLLELQTDISAWSRANFGGNVTVDLRTLNGEVPVALDYLCPLMGIVEEMGELSIAFADNDKVDGVDAIGDMGVYLCDFAGRAEVPFKACPDLKPDGTALSEFMGLVAAVGRLNHVMLKRFQKIRGFEKDDFFKTAQANAVDRIIAKLILFTVEWTGMQFLAVVNDTWEKVISKRNWKKAPADGGGATHLNDPEVTKL